MTGTHLTLERALADYFRAYDVVRAKVVGADRKVGQHEAVLIMTGAVDAAMLRFDILMAVAHAAPHTQPLPSITRMAAELYVRERVYEAARDRSWM